MLLVSVMTCSAVMPLCIASQYATRTVGWYSNICRVEQKVEELQDPTSIQNFSTSVATILMQSLNSFLDILVSSATRPQSQQTPKLLENGLVIFCLVLGAMCRRTPSTTNYGQLSGHAKSSTPALPTSVQQTSLPSSTWMRA